MEKVNHSILDSIGKTPLIRLNKVTKNLNCSILAKIEGLNPGGSVKDRICLSMINEAEKQGLI